MLVPVFLINTRVDEVLMLILGKSIRTELYRVIRETSCTSQDTSVKDYGKTVLKHSSIQK